MKRNVIKSVVSQIFCLLFLVGCSKSSINVAEVIGSEQMKLDYYNASYVIDETDLTQVTTLASYVFVADVVSYEKTEYLNDEDDSPLTFYKIRVHENIKGELCTDADIELKKAGGLIRGTDTFSISVGDVLPQPGKTYLFAATIFDNDLYCSMPNMVVLLDDETDWSQSEVVQEYKKACETVHPDVPNGEQFKSQYDAGEH